MGTVLTLSTLEGRRFLDHPVHLPSLVSRTCQRWFCPQAFDSLQSLVPVCPTVQFKTLKFWFLWYLLLEVFTCTSFPIQNPVTVARRRAPASLTVFTGALVRIRCLPATGFLRWLNTLPTSDQNTTKVPLEGAGAIVTEL